MRLSFDLRTLASGGLERRVGATALRGLGCSLCRLVLLSIVFNQSLVKLVTGAIFRPPKLIYSVHSDSPSLMPSPSHHSDSFRDLGARSFLPKARHLRGRFHLRNPSSVDRSGLSVNSAAGGSRHPWQSESFTFGATPEDHQVVRSILQTVNYIVSSRVADEDRRRHRERVPARKQSLSERWTPGRIGGDGEKRPVVDMKTVNYTVSSHVVDEDRRKHRERVPARKQSLSERWTPGRIGADKEKRPIVDMKESSLTTASPPQLFTESIPTPMPTRAPRKPDPEHERALAQKLDYFRRKLPKDVDVRPGRLLDEDLFDDTTPEEHGQYFEGDIVLWKDQAEEILEKVIHEPDRRKKRKFIRSRVRRWEANEPIEYSFDGSHTKKEQEYIELALQHWQNITCLDFVRNDSPPTGNRIVFTDVDGCASNVGRHPLGEPQFVSIAQECLRLGVIAHEVAHALGFWHEQSRPDRDDFVTVMWNHIEFGSAGQFIKEMLEDVDSNGIAYDYGSIMHYRSKAFTRSNQLYTIQTNIADYQRTIGQRDQLSFNDIKLMNSMYCTEKCPQKLPCQRGGYTDPRKCHRCRCPDGFTGRYCERVMRGFGVECGGEVPVSAIGDVIASPSHPEHFKKGQECSWLITAPEGHHVELEFSDVFDLYCKSKHSLCMDYIEIRNSSDFANTGMRYCCYTTPPGKIYSETNEMLVLFRSFYQKGRGFKANVKSVASTGSFGDWGEWSQCTASCGGCGTRLRYRSCNGPVCSGEAIESEPCNTHACSKCSTPSRMIVPCGLWGLFRCEKETETFIPCDRECCPGYKNEDGVCKRSAGG